MSIAACWQGPGVVLKAFLRRTGDVIHKACTCRQSTCAGRRYDGQRSEYYACLRGASSIQDGIAATLAALGDVIGWIAVSDWQRSERHQKIRGTGQCM